MPTTQKHEKEQKRNLLLRHGNLPKNTRAVILSFIEDKQISDFLQTACDVLGITYLTGTTASDPTYIEGADAFVADILFDSLPTRELIHHGVVPILPSGCHKSFSEFNPMKFEGNGFFFEQTTEFHILEKIIRYLENVRYPGDKRMLLENVIKTKL